MPDPTPLPTAPEPSPDPGSDGLGLAARREQLRRGLRRANTAVATILLAVSALALAAVIAGSRAERNRRRAEEAERKRAEQLWQSHLEHARSARETLRMGRRFEGLEAVQAARRIRPSLELRSQAAALLALLDFRQETNVATIPADANEHGKDFQFRHYAVADAAGDLDVFSMDDHRLLRRFRAGDYGLKKAQGPIQAFRFSDDGRYVGVRYRGGAVLVWELDSGRGLFQSVPRRLADEGGLPVFSADNRYLAFTDLDASNCMAIVELSTARVVQRLPQLSAYSAFRFQPGAAVLTVSTGPEVQSWDVQTGQKIDTLPHPTRVRGFAWNWDGTKLAAGCDDTEVYLWDVPRHEFQVFSGHTAPTWHLAFNAQDTLLSTCGLDGTCRIWDPQSGRLLLTANDRNVIAFSATGEQASYQWPGEVEGLVRVVGPCGFHSFTVRGVPGTAVRGMDLSPDGRWLAAASEAGLQIWDTASKRQALAVPMNDLLGVDFTTNSAGLWLTHSNRLTVRLLRPADTLDLGPEDPLLLPPNLIPRYTSFATDGQRAVVAARDGRIVLVDRAAPGKWIWMQTSTDSISANNIVNLPGSRRVEFTSDGQWVGCAWGPFGKCLFDPGTGKVARSIAGNGGRISFSPDSQWFLIGNYDEYLVFGVADGKRRGVLPRNGHNLLEGSISASGGPGFLATVHADQSIRLASLATGAELVTLTPPVPQTVSGLRFDALGRRLAVATSQHEIHLWDLVELRRGLADLQLDWADPATNSLAASSAAWPVPMADSSVLLAAAPSPTTNLGRPMALTVLGVFGAALAVFCALLILRRHRRLAEEFVQADAVATQREHELRSERELSRLKSSFISTVSHEFRTPLGIIMSSADILRKYADRLRPGQQTEHLADIVAATERMRDLMEEVLLLGRVESGRLPCNPKPVDLVAVARRVISNVVAVTHQRCPIQLDTPTPQAEALLDETLVDIMLTNLLSNAVKYSPAGRPVHLALRHDSSRLIIEVRDEGIGIPTSDQARLFDSFYRAANVGDAPGSGLGLTIVKRCVELHGGEIHLHSVEGQGTIFTVHLPRPAPQATPVTGPSRPTDPSPPTN